MSRRRFLCAALYGGLAAACPLRAVAQTEPLRMAVHPYGSTLSLVAVHRPLVQFLEKSLGRPVEFYTAASFDAYVAALGAGEYDIAISPPHFGVLAVESRAYLPLAHYAAPLEPFLVVRREAALQQPGDLAGKRIAMADRTAFIRLVIIKKLADAGLVAGRDYEIVEMPTHAAAIMAAARGAADAGLAMGTILRLQPEDVQQGLRPILTGLGFPNLFTLAHRRLGDDLVARLKAALLAFPGDPAGKAFFERTGYGGYDAITPDEIAVLAPYAAMVRPAAGRT